MKQILLSAILLLLLNTGSGQTRKILFIGIDGCRWDAVLEADAPALDGLLNNATYSGNGLTEYTTWSGTGWSGMLTGVWHTKHGVTDNSFSGSNFQQFPDFISRAETANPALSTISIAHWAPINTSIIQDIDTEYSVATDLEVKNTAVDILTNANADILFVAFDDVDHAGHANGFSPDVDAYIESIETTDDYITEILAALYNRPTYASEDWLVLVTTDHGGNMAGHGGGTLEERTIFNIYNNPQFVSEPLLRQEVSNSATFSEAHLPAGTYAIPATQEDFEFGASQDFTIEFWVKANVYNGDPAFISNKDWNSGLNPGIVISAQNGQFWKVNIGDGNDRLDIQGGTISPGVWHHLAVSCDRNGLMTAYEDGAVVGMEWMQDIGDITSGLPFVINQDGTTEYGYAFDGSIRDIRVWSDVVPESELVEWATVPVTAAHPHFSSLIANWRCEDGNGSVLSDAGPNGNDCAVTGSINWMNDQTSVFQVYDYSETPRQPDNAVTALTWMCIPIDPTWGIDGQSRVQECSASMISNNSKQNGIVVSPNPTSGYVKLQLPETANGKQLELMISDLAGRVVHQSSIWARNVEIDLNALPSGVYMLHCVCGDLSDTTRLILQH